MRLRDVAVPVLVPQGSNEEGEAVSKPIEILIRGPGGSGKTLIRCLLRDALVREGYIVEEFEGGEKVRRTRGGGKVLVRIDTQLTSGE